MNIEIKTEELSNDISNMRNCVGDLNNAKTQVFSCLDSLNGMWVGSAHDAFVAQTAVDAQELKALIDNLNELIECMEYAKTEYDNCQSSVNDAVAAIQLSGDY